jgi:hypothetical protein
MVRGIDFVEDDSESIKRDVTNTYLQSDHMTSMFMISKDGRVYWSVQAICDLEGMRDSGKFGPLVRSWYCGDALLAL